MAKNRKQSSKKSGKNVASPNKGDMADFLKITLKSDLCSASGFAFAGVIDTDVQYDRYGIPSISGKSIKGCIRDAATKYLKYDKDTIEKLFGAPGKEDIQGVFIGRAYPENAEEIRKEIDHLDERYQKYTTRQRVLNQYTHVRNQTSINENGSAEENSLRFTRVVNHRMDRTEMVFLAPVDFDPEIREEFEKALNATRHIGLHRNRGLGNVRIELDQMKIKLNTTKKYTRLSEPVQKIVLSVKNMAPLMLSGENDQISQRYISGRMFLGAMAARYLTIDGCTADDEVFKDLFLRGEAKFSDLRPAKKIYIEEEIKSEKKNKKKEQDNPEKNLRPEPLEPAPIYLRKLKKTEYSVNVLKMSEYNPANDPEHWYDYRGGNQPKKMKDRWISRNNAEEIDAVHEVQTEIIYHHSKIKENSKNELGLLYYQDAIEAGQYFAGDIIFENKKVEGCPAGQKDYATILFNLIGMGDFRFGKSRTAEYGTCKVVNYRTEPYNGTQSVDPGDIVITFLSDALFCDNSGNYSVQFDAIKEQVEKAIVEQKVENAHQEIMHPYGKVTDAYLTTKVVEGYNGKWNLQKQHMPVIAAGSAVIFKLDKRIEACPKMIGERIFEGFGRIRIDRLSDMHYEVGKLEELSKNEEKEEPKETKAMLISAVLQDIKEDLYQTIYADSESINISSSALGRLTLTTDEVIRPCMSKESKKDPEKLQKCMSDLIRRINSIKIKDTKNEINQFMRNVLSGKKSGELTISAFYHYVEGKISNNDALDDLKQLVGEASALQYIYGLWPEYFKTVLTYQKYQKKEV